MEQNHPNVEDALAKLLAEHTDESIDRLSDLFDAVKDLDDWKAPIHARVHAFDLQDTVEAIKFYTATVPIILDDGPEYFRVHASGYRAGPAGDH